MIAKPSAEPTPRPPVTTTFASASETPPVAGGDAVAHPDDEVGVGELGANVLDRAGAPGRLGGDRVRRDGQQRCVARAGAPPRAGCRPSACASAYGSPA